MNMLYGLGFYRCDFATCAVRFLLRHFVVVVVVVVFCTVMADSWAGLFSLE